RSAGSARGLRSFPTRRSSDLGEEELARTAKEIEAAGGRAVAVPTDVTDPSAVQNLVDRTVEAFGTVDVLVNNAGAAPFMSTLEQDRKSTRLNSSHVAISYAVF